MGFNWNDDDWIDHQDGFKDLLDQLASNKDPSIVKPEESEKVEIKSLEKKSMNSRARVQ